ncbi:ORC2-domain-containing protein [Mollisia scopiformis]|uniref:Origin recognition complex subunit 2 n=1 Tax=Mollisia scopiformis TaxID=149040 RepID=A0A194WUR3_MOLSC|nr:ORC2-domain-containing protein [Mollisia scopiformis]KUJ11703.1 ORC2-domain-containing protein [Mollisia scopiformis]
MPKRRKTVDEDEAQVDQGEEELAPKKSRSSLGKSENGTPIKTNSSKRRSLHSQIVADEDEASESREDIEAAEETNDLSEGDELAEEEVQVTPSNHTTSPHRRNGNHPISRTPSKGLLNKKLFSTPTKNTDTTDVNDTPRITRNADRSARKKSTRNLIERTILGNTSENDEEEDELAGHIYGSDDEDDLGEDADGLPDDSNAPATPSKRGRAKGSKNRRRSPTPPENLAPHEKYFIHNRGGRAKTSNNNLSSLALLDHEEYFGLARDMKDSHADRIKFLEELHAEDFKQWQFELSQNFNICVYGWGSKKSLLMQFADRTYNSQADHSKSKIIVVNGYVHNLTVKDVLNTVALAVAERGTKLGAQPAEMLENLIALLEDDKDQRITLIIHSIDRPPLRKSATQTVLSRLSAHPQVQMVASADHPSFPLLWDSSLRSTYNFLFHDCTTFKPYTNEIDVVDEVHELLGRSGRRVGGKEGVSFVLKSLPENAKNLFRVLIGEQLAAMEGGSGAAADGDEDDDYEKQPTKFRNNDAGVEYRVLYKKVVEEFICSNDMAFRTLLKEFHDHQMIQSRKDALGTEMLWVPFRKEELETILEDIMS